MIRRNFFDKMRKFCFRSLLHAGRGGSAGLKASIHHFCHFQKTFAERLEYLCTFNEVADTNVEAVFDLILDAAVRNNVPQEELPETLYLISDMEFNACVRNASVSNFASAKRRFAEHGYRLPQIVFWNVASRNSNQPVTKNEQGVALVSGCTPRLFSMVASGDLSPYSVMMDIIESERYAKISA